MASWVIVPLLLQILGTISHIAASKGNVTFCVKGFVPPVLTPVDKDGKLNLDIIPKYAQYLKDCDIDGVLVGGTNGEGPKLCVEDKKKLLDAWLDAARPLGLTVMMQVGGMPLPDVKELAKYSEKVGVDGILCLPELYYKPKTVKDLVYNMECVASAAPNTPFLYYDIPTYTNVEVDLVEFFEEATAKIPNFKGAKLEEFEIAPELRTKLKGDQRLFIANLPGSAPGALIGFEDFIMTESYLFPDLMRKMIRCALKCHSKKAREYQEKLIKFTNAMNKYRPTIASTKEAMRLITGIDMGPVLPPEMGLTDKQKQELKADLEEAGVELKEDEE